MGYSKELLDQLNFGEGETLFGDTPLAILKAFMQSGVSYLGGYPGSPTAGLIDAIYRMKGGNWPLATFYWR